MRAMAWVLYWIGDFISNTILRFGWGYSIYNKAMTWSLRLDKKDEIWKRVK
jgi:hypothetical protein